MVTTRNAFKKNVNDLHVPNYSYDMKYIGRFGGSISHHLRDASVSTPDGNAAMAVGNRARLRINSFSEAKSSLRHCEGHAWHETITLPLPRRPRMCSLPATTMPSQSAHRAVFVLPAGGEDADLRLTASLLPVTQSHGNSNLNEPPAALSEKRNRINFPRTLRACGAGSTACTNSWFRPGAVSPQHAADHII